MSRKARVTAGLQGRLLRMRGRWTDLHLQFPITQVMNMIMAVCVNHVWITECDVYSAEAIKMQAELMQTVQRGALMNTIKRSYLSLHPLGCIARNKDCLQPLATKIVWYFHLFKYASLTDIEQNAFISHANIFRRLWSSVYGVGNYGSSRDISCLFSISPYSNTPHSIAHDCFMFLQSLLLG